MGWIISSFNTSFEILGGPELSLEYMSYGVETSDGASLGCEIEVSDVSSIVGVDEGRRVGGT